MVPPGAATGRGRGRGRLRGHVPASAAGRPHTLGNSLGCSKSIKPRAKSGCSESAFPQKEATVSGNHENLKIRGQTTQPPSSCNFCPSQKPALPSPNAAIPTLHPMEAFCCQKDGGGGKIPTFHLREHLSNTLHQSPFIPRLGEL